jgi:hypothetical protein
MPIARRLNAIAGKRRSMTPLRILFRPPIRFRSNSQRRANLDAQSRGIEMTS